MGNRLLDVIDLKAYFITPRSTVKAVDGVSFHIDEKETLGIIGESGCGKTATALTILRLLPRPAGTIVGGQMLFEGLDLVKLTDRQMQAVRGAKISMILQDPMASLNPVFNIGNQIGEAIVARTRMTGGLLNSRVIEMLKRVKIPSPETRLRDYPHQMSGGMKQRVVGAISISCHPQLLIADEPTTSLDVTIQAQYLQLLKDLQAEYGMAIIFITHDFGIVATICDRVAVMYAGQVVETASVRDIFYRPQHPYTMALLKAVPKLETDIERLASIQGQPPRLNNPPPGCRFAPRCEKATERCQRFNPELMEIKPEHFARCWLVQGNN